MSTVGLGHYTELPGITTATASSEATVTALHIVHLVSRPVSLVSVIPRQLVSESVKSQHSAKTAGSENTEKEKSEKPSCLTLCFSTLSTRLYQKGTGICFRKLLQFLQHFQLFARRHARPCPALVEHWDSRPSLQRMFEIALKGRKS